MYRIIIISGGRLEKESALAFLGKNSAEIVIGVDGGLRFCYENKVVPNYIVGDFDTIEPEILKIFSDNPKIQMVKYQPEKDLTDTQAAVELAIKLLGGKEGEDVAEIILLGGIGSRMDHTLANIGCLQYAQKQKVFMKIVDGNNCMYLYDKSFFLRKECLIYQDYLSLIALEGGVSELTIKGMKYNTDKIYLEPLSSLGVSNEMVGDKAEIIFSSGVLLVIESKD
ncbi:MAG: thiamine diphosphokinase [Lachnospiraceae bacterium]|nr:thiamine diphosphokinase [Lachnospiraceae bacterium]